MTSAPATPSGHVTRVTIPLRYRDLDTLGHLNQSVYHVMLEEARVAFILDVLQKRLGEFVLARVELDYRHEVRLDDREVVIDTWLDHVGTSSIRLASRLTKPDGAVAAEGATVLVGWDPERRGARRLSAEERTALEAAQAERG
jgi:acyl-CoA thioester hydrolase